MKWNDKSKLAALMAFHLLWGLVSWFSISKYGLGVSTDSVQLLFGGFNLAQGRGLVSYDGSFVVLWPPLYPALLAFLHLITGFGMLAAAQLLQAICFVGLSFCLAVLFLRAFPDNFLLALAGTVLADVGSVMLIGFNMVGSDYLHLLLVVLYLVLVGTYIESKSPRVFVGLAAVGMLSMLARYLGIAVIATGALVIMILAGGNLTQRLGRALFVSVAALPAGLWLAITSQMYSRREATSFAENFNWFSKSILEWFFEPQDLKRHLTVSIIWLWAIIIALSLLVAVLSRQQAGTDRDSETGADRREGARAFRATVFAFGICYTLALFGSAAIAYSNKLGGRFLLPLYIPLITLPVAAADFILHRARALRSPALRLFISASCYGALAGLALLLLQVTLPIVLQSRADGAAGGENVYNTRTWRENAAVVFWQSHVPKDKYVLYSNEPDGVAFNTWSPTEAAPLRTSGPYGTEQYPLSNYTTELFSSGVDVYMLWIEPNPYPYYYGVEELAAIAEIDPLFASDAGGVYRLRPKAGP